MVVVAVQGAPEHTYFFLLEMLQLVKSEFQVAKSCYLWTLVQLRSLFFLCTVDAFSHLTYSPDLCV